MKKLVFSAVLAIAGIFLLVGLQTNNQFIALSGVTCLSLATWRKV